MPKVNGVFAPLVNTTIQLPAQSRSEGERERLQGFAPEVREGRGRISDFAKLQPYISR